MIHTLFTEKYRPKNLDELILPETVMNKFKDGLTQNMLLTGSPGRIIYGSCSKQL